MVLAIYNGNAFLFITALFCVCLIYHIDGLPQSGYGSSQRHNSTAWRHNTTQHRPSQTIGNRNYTNPNIWQPQGQRPWLNNNQSHPHIQVPGFMSNLHYAAAKQPNRSISEGTGWRQPQPVAPYLKNWSPQRSNSTQNVPIRSEPFRNNGGGQLAPINSGWVASSNSANSTIWKGGVSREFLPQANNRSNSYPTWHAGLPGSTLVAGTHTGNSLVGSASEHQNTANTGWNLPSGQPNGTYSAHPYGKLFA